MIEEGRIKIDDVVVRDLFTPFAQDQMRLHVDGKEYKGRSERAHFLFNKPLNCLCSARGPGKRVIDYFCDLPHRFFTVGRLDKETTGLIIVTNDGEFAHSIMHPRFGIAKEYEVVADELISSLHLEQLSQGAMLDGVWVKPLKVLRIDLQRVRLWVGEGKNREIRRLMKACGLGVVHLMRLSIGQLKLGSLAIGQRKAMTEDERRLAATPDPLLLKRSKERSRFLN